MSGELPSSHHGGRSVFSVFGFGGHRYKDVEDFDSPLESAPESFDASNYHTVTKVCTSSSGNSQKQTVTPKSPETARKMRVNLPDNSGLILQSICQTGGKPHPGQSQPVSTSHASSSEKHPTYARRYSTPQEDAEDKFDTNKVLQKFNSTLHSSSYRFAPHYNASIYNNFAPGSNNVTHTSTTTTVTTQVEDVSSPPPHSSTLSRVKSSPHLSVMNVQTNFRGKPPANISGDTDISSAGALSRGLRRNQSQGDLLEAVQYKMGGGDGGDGSSRDKKPTAPSSSSPSDFHTPLHPDMTDGEHARHSKFGLLSRTRQFGAWLTKATEGEKVEVTKKDLNVLAPNSF